MLATQISTIALSLITSPSFFPAHLAPQNSSESVKQARTSREVTTLQDAIAKDLHQFLSSDNLCRVPGVPAADHPGVEPERRFKQLTFSPCGPAAVDFADPSPPVDKKTQVIVVYGAGILHWQGSTPEGSWRHFLRGDHARYEHVPLFHGDGLTEFDVVSHGEEAWDMTIENFADNADPVLYAGVMTPAHGQSHADVLRDHWSRRTYPFYLRDGKWQQGESPLFFAPATFGWIGHNYGHQFFKDQDGSLWIFYERVSESDTSGPLKTELFARSFVPPETVGDEEIKIFEIANRPYPSVLRAFGGALVEGPRPFSAETGGRTFYFIAFSSGQWDSSGYTANLLWSEALLGPYQPYLNDDRTDLKDFGAELKKTYPLTYGPGRPVFFQDPGKHWWTVFHAANSIEVEHAKFPPAPGRGPFRNLFLAPVQMSLSPLGLPVVEIINEEALKL